MMTKNRHGLLLATTAAALFASGITLAAEQGSKAAHAKVHCAGVNSCKGQTACKSATNACKGQNSCKGQGWLPMSKKECKAKGGTVIKM
jgi:uncharacterized membrane protein